MNHSLSALNMMTQEVPFYSPTQSPSFVSYSHLNPRDMDFKKTIQVTCDLMV